MVHKNDLDSHYLFSPVLVFDYFVQQCHNFILSNAKFC